MFVKVTTPDNEIVAVNPDAVRAIYRVHDKRCNIAFIGEDRTLATNMGIDNAIALLSPKPTSARATRKTASSE